MRRIIFIILLMIPFQWINAIDLLIQYSDEASGIEYYDENTEGLLFINDVPISYFTVEFLAKAITDQNFSYGDIIFDKTKSDGLRIYYGGRLFYDSDSILRYIEYGNYNVIVVTQEIMGIEYVQDYLILEKQNPETYLFNSSGTVQIDGDFSHFDITVVVNKHWRGRFTEDISHAFIVNLQTKKIEPVVFNTIKLYSEL